MVVRLAGCLLAPYLLQSIFIAQKINSSIYENSKISVALVQMLVFHISLSFCLALPCVCVVPAFVQYHFVFICFNASGLKWWTTIANKFVSVCVYLLEWANWKCSNSIVYIYISPLNLPVLLSALMLLFFVGCSCCCCYCRITAKLVGIWNLIHLRMWIVFYGIRLGAYALFVFASSLPHF